MNWTLFASKSLEGIALSREEAHAVLDAGPGETLPLVAAAYQVRQRYFGKRVRLNYLLNAKSGLCPEDCSYCSQSKISSAPIEKYAWLSVEETVAMADRAVNVHAGRFCMVASGRGPSAKEIKHVVECVSAVRAKHPHLEICCCLGLLSPGQAESLKDAGVHAVNHNLNTSERYYGEICETNTYSDRLDTVEKVKKAGLSPCSGALLGMGETQDDVIELAMALRALEVESLPVNFLMPIKGTPLAGRWELTPTRCLNILCLYRFLNSKASLRISGGREVHLRSLQALGLYVANSIFIGDYLTTKGQPAQADLEMIRDMGFEIEGDVPRVPALAVPIPEVVLK
jgi:biotin synthase